jgi:hypothetical protein
MFLKEYHKGEILCYSVFSSSEVKGFMFWKTLMRCTFSGLCLAEHGKQILRSTRLSLVSWCLNHIKVTML